MIDKIKLTLRKTRKNVLEYIVSNRLFITYTIIALIGLLLVRHFTVGNILSFKTFIVDFALVLIIGSFGYLVKPKTRYRYFFVVLTVFTIMEVINSVYYTFYYSFASLGELSTLGQTETVMSSIYEKIKITDLIYILFPFIFYLIHKKMSKSVYYTFMSSVEKGKKMCAVTLLTGCIFLAYTFVTATGTDYSRLAKQWNRVYIVERFGVVLYHCNDLIQTLTPKLSSLFGYEESAQKFTQYFTADDIDKYKGKNKYTNILEGYNVVFVHMEGIETYLMDLEFNDKEAVPNVNKLAKEGMFFSNFYPQISIGTSSDTEFTLLTSLMPASSGAVFTSYYNRNYISLPKLLKEKGYYTFSMHGNHASMWNRSNVHPNLGYDKMYFEKSFTYTEEDVINLGINDKLFFKQAIPIIEDVEKNNQNYMGTIITLSNHSPFTFLDKYGEYDMSSTFNECDEQKHCEKVTTNYLSNTAVGNYITSAHYADAALGEFFEYVNDSEYFNNTVFVLYGDHDAKLSRKEKNYLYNYDYRTGELKTEEDEDYQEYDSYDHEMNKKTPLIIWTKNKTLRNKLHGKVDYVMGMYDVLPTLGNMLGIENKYALGHDIFNIKNDNFVVFPSGNFITNLIYYNNSTGQSKIIKENAELSSDYISTIAKKAEAVLEVSNSIIVHDLIKLEGDKVKAIKENGVEE